MFFFRLLVARQPRGQNLSKVCQKISLNLNFLVKSQKFGKSHPTALPARKRCFGLLASILDCVHSRELSFEIWPQIGLNFFPSILWPIRTIFERMGAVSVSLDPHFLTFLIFPWNGGRLAPPNGLFRAWKIFRPCRVQFLVVVDRQDASYGPVGRPPVEYSPSQGSTCAEKNYPSTPLGNVWTLSRVLLYYLDSVI